VTTPASGTFSTLLRRRWRKIVCWGVLGAFLAGSAGLLLACLEFYRREQRVRLNPTLPVPAMAVRADPRPPVLFLGDSRMQDWPDLPGDRFSTVNCGGGGETTAQILLRARATLEVTRPALVVLQAGVNDLKAIGALPDMAREIETKCLANLSTLVELCRAHGARVVLVPILPTAAPSLARRLVWSPEIDAARRRVNAALRERFAGTAGVALLDENLLHPDQENLLHPDQADYRDTLHFTPAAYRKLESAALTAISAL
jgi:lysophospholipase L1-like esterase